MNAKWNLGLLAACLVAIGLPAFGQIDGAKYANDLRAKYGPRLARETLTVRPGIEMIVDYAANGHVCRIDLPGVALSRDSAVINVQAIDELVSGLVPLTMRGKERGKSSAASGIHSVTVDEYENVTIAEGFQERIPTGVAVIFSHGQCQQQSGK